MNRTLQVTSCIAGVLFFTLSAYAAEITIGTGTSTAWIQPLPTAYHDARTQTIYLASEIGGPKELTSLALNVFTKPGQVMNYFTIRLKHTDLSSYDSSPAWESSGWTMVYQANTTISTTGWVTFPFTTPFVYNGTQNLMVDISFNNSSCTTDGWCYYTSSSVTRSIYYRTDSDYGDPLTWTSRTPTPSAGARFPNIRLGYGVGNVIFNPDGGTYNTEPNVVITCATPGATIRYTLDGSDPNSGTIIASGSSVFIDHTLTLKAVAWKDGFPYSAKSASYQLVVATPVFTPDGGAYNTEQEVVITCATPDATIHYTTNGLDPNQSDPVIENGNTVTVAVNPPTTLKAKAFKTGWSGGNIKTALYRYSSIKYGGGSGTPEDPYQIATKQDLLYLSVNTDDYDKCFILTADIDLEGQVFNKAIIAAGGYCISFPGGISPPAGNNLTESGEVYYQGASYPGDSSVGTPFRGTFNGNNYKIANFMIATSGAEVSCGYDYFYFGRYGLFGRIDAGGRVQNLGIENVIMEITAYGGGLAGENTGIISNCYVMGTVEENGEFVGGLVGANSGTIENCHSDVDVHSYHSYGRLGGLAGINNGYINSCCSVADVTGVDALVFAGGLVGANSGNISNCYSTGNVAHADTAGGLIGWNGGEVYNSYSTGHVTWAHCGGLIGDKGIGSSAMTINSFWDTQTSGLTTSAGGTGKTTAQMKTLSTFTSAGWDFSTTDGDPVDWVMPSPPDYPKLAWNYHLVGLNEFNLLSQYWLMSGCIDAQPCAVADWYEDGTIDILDLDVLAEHWLSGYIEKQYPPMVIHWPMDESSGSVVSDAAGLHHGQLVNMDPNTCWTTGHINNALQFDGINDYVQITGYKGISGSQARTCAAWIKATSTGQHQIAMSLGGPDPAPQTWYFGGIFTAPNTTEFAVGIGSYSYIKCSATPFDNQWHHVAVVLPDDGSPTTSEMKLYLDGQLRTDTTIVNGTLAINTSGTRDVYLGAYTGNTTPTLFFKGLLDDVRMYNYALSDAEIIALAQ